VENAGIKEEVDTLSVDESFSAIIGVYTVQLGGSQGRETHF
jgi:hypothetical protein